MKDIKRKIMHSLTLGKHKNFLNDFVSWDKLILSLDTRGFLPFLSFGAQRIKYMLT